jgi:hypothetical protein
MSNPADCLRVGQDRANLYNEITDKIIAGLRPAASPGFSPGVRPRRKRRWPCRKMRRPTGNAAALTSSYSGAR